MRGLISQASSPTQQDKASEIFTNFPQYKFFCLYEKSTLPQMRGKNNLR